MSVRLPEKVHLSVGEVEEVAHHSLHCHVPTVELAAVDNRSLATSTQDLGRVEEDLPNREPALRHRCFSSPQSQGTTGARTARARHSRLWPAPTAGLDCGAAAEVQTGQDEGDGGDEGAQEDGAGPVSRGASVPPGFHLAEEVPVVVVLIRHLLHPILAPSLIHDDLWP